MEGHRQSALPNPAARIEESYPLLDGPAANPTATGNITSSPAGLRGPAMVRSMIPPKNVGVQNRNVRSSQSSSSQSVRPPISTPPIATGSAFGKFEKLGWLAFLVLALGFVAILASIGFLLFLWLGDSSNRTWSAIAVHNWSTRAVALSALVLRSATSLQAAVATSMLAGIAVERMQVLLIHLASVSTMRNAAAGPYWFTWLMLRAFGKNPARLKNCLVPALAILLTITTLLLQFTSTVLLSDLVPQVIPGDANSETLATNFEYDVNSSIPIVYRGAVWNKQPAFYPTFAEYHEPPTTNEAGISDTGLTLRAFLPVRDQSARSLLRNYTGRATVVNTQVRCQIPPTTKVLLYRTNSFLGLSTNLDGFTVGTVIPFSLKADDSPATHRVVLSDLGAPGTLSDGITSPSSPLNSPFRGSNSSFFAGRSFLAVNISSGSQQDWAQVISLADAEFQDFKGTGNQPGQAPLLFSDENEWRDFWWTANASLRVSVTVCYTGLDSVDIGIDTFTANNLTEPGPSYDLSRSTYTYDGIRQQLGQSLDGTVSYGDSTRQIMQMKKRQSWMSDTSTNSKDYDYQGVVWYDVSWLNDFLAMTGPRGDLTTNRVYQTNYTTFLTLTSKPDNEWSAYTCITADPSIIALAQEIFMQGGSIAFALQSILTVFSGMAYYDQMLQFNGVSNVSEQAFVIATVRKHFRGIIAVSAVVGMHLILVAVILTLFFVTTNVSTVGNAWQAVAQVHGEQTEDVLREGKLWTDGEVKKPLNRATMAGIEQQGNTTLIITGADPSILSSRTDGEKSKTRSRIRAPRRSSG